MPTICSSPTTQNTTLHDESTRYGKSCSLQPFQFSINSTTFFRMENTYRQNWPAIKSTILPKQGLAYFCTATRNIHDLLPFIHSSLPERFLTSSDINSHRQYTWVNTYAFFLSLSFKLMPTVEFLLDN